LGPRDRGEHVNNTHQRRARQHELQVHEGRAHRSDL
jgi:hypothetical protein